jgi:hypothetical protein
MWVVGMIALILMSLPLTPILWGAAARALGPRFNAVGYIVLLAVLAGFAGYVVIRHPGMGTVGLVPLAGFGLLYWLLLKYQCRFPSERLHLLEYGLLAGLAYRAFRFDFPRLKAYVLGFLLAVGFGIVDELIQYVLPNRVFEVRDIVTNALAAALGLVTVAVVLRPNSSGAPSRGAHS